MNNLEKHIINKLRGQTRSQTQTCFNPGCTNNAIRSHILQRNGILNKISDRNGYVYQLALNDLYRETTYRFEYSSIAGGDVLTFWGFCNNCDTSVFEEIELKIPDFDYYKHSLLFSYRALLKELYKVQYNSKHFRAIINHNSIGDPVKEFYRNKLFKSEFIEKVDLNLKNLIETELKSDFTNNTFEFKTFRLPNLQIATSALYTPPQFEVINPELSSSNYLSSYFDRARQMVFFHLIPIDHGTIFILGHHKETFGVDTLTFSDFEVIENIESLVSETLIKRIETWCISTDLLVKLKLKGIDERILKLKEENLHGLKDKKIDLNLFETLKH